MQVPIQLQHENKTQYVFGYWVIVGIDLMTPSSPRCIRGRALSNTIPE